MPEFVANPIDKLRLILPRLDLKCPARHMCYPHIIHAICKLYVSLY